MYINILSKDRINLLPLLKNFKNDFYLAGGTGLALIIGHRDSVDFDFFTNSNINTSKLYSTIEDIFKNHKIKKVQDEKNTLTILINNTKISFFTYKYPLLKDVYNEKYFNIASIYDIGCMKLLTITNRSTNKDFIDLYFILQKITFDELIKLSVKKFKNIDTDVILKSLVYFDDMDIEPINFKNNNFVDMNNVKKYFISLVKKVN